MELQITLARSTAIPLCAVITGRRVLADPADFEETSAVFAACAPAIYEIIAGTNALAARTTNVVVTAEADVEFRLVYPRPPAGPVHFKAVYLDKLPREGYGAMLTVLDMVNRTVLGQQLLTVGNTVMEVTVQAPASASSSDSGTARVPAERGAATPAPAPRPSLRAFLKLGVEHILTGYDHLLFLCALLVACRRFSSMLVIISCFTLAHSITLAVAALNLVTVSSRIVEPLIAATIVFVGVENLVRGEKVKGRGWLAFGFGLIHGFGFAGALREAGLGVMGSSIVGPLFSFNFGVELGQMAVVAIVLPILLQLRKSPAFARHGLRAVSLVVVALGTYWLWQRTLPS
jgi:hydrogenase/urease accessory protein HupE